MHTQLMPLMKYITICSNWLCITVSKLAKFVLKKELCTAQLKTIFYEVQV